MKYHNSYRNLVPQAQEFGIKWPHLESLVDPTGLGVPCGRAYDALQRRQGLEGLEDWAVIPFDRPNWEPRALGGALYEPSWASGGLHKSKKLLVSFTKAQFRESIRTNLRCMNMTTKQ